MIIINSVIRLVLKAISACGLIDGQRDSATSRSNRVEKRDSPFVLVGRAPDGRWGVFQQDFVKPQALFDELQDACNYANELSKSRINSMVLIQNSRDSGANPNSSIAQGTV